MPSNGKIVYCFIDASNLWAAQKVKGKFFDFQKLKRYLKEANQAVELKVFYYTAYPKEGTREYSMDGRHKFLTFLKKGLGFTVRKKELKRINVQTIEGLVIQEKGNMDVEITIDAIHHKKTYDVALLFSGDSDFLSLVTYLKADGKKVIIYSSKNNISEELRTGADGYFDVLSIDNDIWGLDLKFRNSKK